MHETFRQAREAKGWTLDEATFQARLRYPDLRIKRGKIHRIEQGITDRDRLNVVTVAALAQLYGVPLDALPVDVRDEARASLAVLSETFSEDLEDSDNAGPTQIPS